MYSMLFVIASALWIFAAARISRAVTTDTISGPLRSRIGALADTGHRAWVWLALGLACDWCVTVWVAGLPIFAAWAWCPHSPAEGIDLWWRLVIAADFAIAAAWFAAVAARLGARA